LVVAVFRTDQDQRVLGDVVSAHVRSLQANHLTDVQNERPAYSQTMVQRQGRYRAAVVDLTAQGFTLLGGRLDYIEGQPVASIVYRRRQHVINLFVTDGAPSETREARLQTLQGLNIQRWAARGLEFFAISDLNAEELREFVDKFEAELHPAAHT